MSNRIVALAMTCLVGCSGGPEDDQPSASVAQLEQPQIDTGTLQWRLVTFRFQDWARTPFAAVFLFNKDTGKYLQGHEYWFVNTASLSLLGTSGLSVNTTTSSSPTPPSDPGYANEQSFELAASTKWGSGWTTDPLTGGKLYTASSGQALRVTQGQNKVTSIAWYQVIPTSEKPKQLTPSPSFSVGGWSVPVPTGSVGFDISQTVP